VKRRTIQIVLIFGIVSIIGIISIQVYFVTRTLNIKEKQINQSINIALRSVANTLSEYNKSTIPSDNPVYQYSSDYFIVEINDVIDAAILEHYLISELESHNVLLDFEYAIYDCYSDVMVYGNYISHLDGTTKSVNNSKLQKYDEYVYYFGVRFPDIRGYVLSSMGVWFFMSVILLIVIIFLDILCL